MANKKGLKRGGRRPGAGRKPKALVDKLMAGQSARIIAIPINQMPDGADIPANDVPEPSAYLSAKQIMDDKEFKAAEIYRETMKWIRDRGCAQIVNPRLVESYADIFARFIQCSEAVSEYGLIGKHPTTGAPMASPFTQLELQYQKQAFQIWSEIFEIIKANSLTPYDGLANVDPMEALLSQ